MRREPSVAIVSDLHAGSRYGLCVSERVRLTGGDHDPPYYVPSRGQKLLTRLWLQYWSWVWRVTGGGPNAVIINGDLIEGVHHRASGLVSLNLADQAAIAVENLRAIASKVPVYIVVGTPAHDTEEGQHIQQVAKSLGAVLDSRGGATRNELWLELGKYLLHVSHEVSVTTSPMSEATPLVGQLVKAFSDTGRWGGRPPDVIVRSHAHRCCIVDLPSSTGGGLALITPAWQLKTPYAARRRPMEHTQFGGGVVFAGDEGPYVRRWVKTVRRGKVEICPAR